MRLSFGARGFESLRLRHIVSAEPSHWKPVKRAEIAFETGFCYNELRIVFILGAGERSI